MMTSMSIAFLVLLMSDSSQLSWLHRWWNLHLVTLVAERSERRDCFQLNQLGELPAAPRGQAQMTGEPIAGELRHTFERPWLLE